LIVERLAGLQSLIKEFGISADSQSAHQLLKYLALLEKWNARINLTAATEWRAVESLFREGIWASKGYPAEAVSHLDIGTGAGFPAIILKILKPNMQLEMVESRTRKSAFVETVIYSLGLDETHVHTMRLDSFLQNAEDNKFWDCITWKGIKLSSSDLLNLKKHAHSGTQFWMFHGKEQAAENREVIERHFLLLRSEKAPFMKEWFLSIYLPQ
jgi:16S rRNA (guanine(527)-N(7))-methyltransferase RsmG